MSMTQTFDVGQVHWYAVQTCVNREKRVWEQMGGRGIEAFVPLYTSRRKWSDRNVELQLPLFPSYVFVHIAWTERLQVLQVPGVARLVSHGNQPTPLPDEDLERLIRANAHHVQTEPYPYLVKGMHVRVKSGCFEGTEGFLIRKKGEYRVVVTLQLISSAFVLDVDAGDLEPVRPSRNLQDGNAVASAGTSAVPLSAACSYPRDWMESAPQDLYSL